MGDDAMALLGLEGALKHYYYYYAKHVGWGTGWLNHGQHPDRQCSRQQNYVLTVHAINHSSNTTINHCGAGGEVLRVLEVGH
jgi:hypothetical protein